MNFITFIFIVEATISLAEKSRRLYAPQSLTTDSQRQVDEWQDHKLTWEQCHRCVLHHNRTKTVLLRGTIPADVLFVGEAPGISEDNRGYPFVGESGYILQTIIDDCNLVSYAITNIVGCLPNNRKLGESLIPPKQEHIAKCSLRIVSLLRLLEPKLIVTVGSIATDALRDHYHNRDIPIPVISIIHPAAILRMPIVKQNIHIAKSIRTIKESCTLNGI